MFRAFTPDQRAQISAMTKAWLGLHGKQSTDILTDKRAGDSIETQSALHGPQGRARSPSDLQKTATNRDSLARLHELETDLTQASALQKTFLPRAIPHVDSLQLFAESRPAAKLGGDYYDFLHSDPQSLIISVGDISGKGLKAAMFMPLIYKVIRTSVKATASPSPRNMLAYASADLYADFVRNNMFATTFVAQYDLSRRRLRYANAGHSPVIYAPVGGGVHLLEADSAPMGVLPKTVCANHEVRMGPGDLMVIGTDGLAEARNRAGELFSYERLLGLIPLLANKSAAVIAHALFGAVAAFTDGRAHGDDQTLVILKGRQ